MVTRPGATGIPVDATGGPTIDPTKNVLDLVGAATLRIDDMAVLRALLNDEKIKRMEREWIHLDQIAGLRAEHAGETRRYDNDRWDKIRSIDMANADAKAAQLLAAVNNYAAAQERMAQTLRDQVASTADAANKNQAALINPIVDRVAILERSSYTVAGRSAVSDPAVERLGQLVEALAKSQATGAGKSEGVSLAWLVALGAVGAMGTIIASAIAVYALLKP